jgi:hypothetical protein
MKHVGRDADQDPLSSQRSRAMLVCAAGGIAGPGAGSGSGSRLLERAHGRQRRFARIDRFMNSRECRVCRGGQEQAR